MMRKKMDQVLGGTLALLMGLMLINVVWQVFSRYVLQAPSAFTDELARYFLIWISLLGAAYVSGKKMHLGIDLLPTKLNPVPKRKLGFLINGLIITFVLLVMVIGGSRLVYITYLLHQTSPALQIPLAYIYTAIPVSGLLIICYKMLDILKKNGLKEDPGIKINR